MILAALDRIAELLGGRGITTHSASEEFGITPGARYALELDRYTDLELMRCDRAALLAEIRAARRTKAGAR